LLTLKCSSCSCCCCCPSRPRPALQVHLRDPATPCAPPLLHSTASGCFLSCSSPCTCEANARTDSASSRSRLAQLQLPVQPATGVGVSWGAASRLDGQPSPWRVPPAGSCALGQVQPPTLRALLPQLLGRSSAGRSISRSDDHVRSPLH